MRFEAGCDPESEEFKEYWNRNGYGQEDKGYSHDRLLEELEEVIKGNSQQLIVWREKGKIVGHAVWHESNTEEHRKGVPRDTEDTKTLKRLLGKNRTFVELHEWWLIENHRGKGHGNKFLDFFETHMKTKGYTDLVFYADHPAALATLRKRGYKEGGYLKGSKEYVFYRPLEETGALR